MVDLPYRGSAPAFADLLAGHAQFMAESIPQVTQYVRQGKVRALGVTSRQRNAALPDVPTLIEQGIPVEAGGSVWLVAPAGLPAPIADRLNVEVNAILAEPDVRRRLAEIGYETVGGSREQASRRIVDEIGKWTRLMRAMGYRPE